MQAVDLETRETHIFKAKAVINATGVFVDAILQMDKPGSPKRITASQGIHLVFDRSFFPNDCALMIPATSDGRVLFAVPWHNYVIVGTTDTPIETETLEPIPLKSEINFILETLNQYSKKTATEQDVLSIYAGLRPLVLPENKNLGTKEISRDHKILVSNSNLITITGGKWTTYRKMAKDTIDLAIKLNNLNGGSCVTESLKLHGYTQQSTTVYGSDEAKITALKESKPELNELLHPDFIFTVADVVWAVRFEMARTVDDILARRLRILFLNAKIAVQLAPTIASLMAVELQRDADWETLQVENFNEIAQNYMIEAYQSRELNLNKTY